MTPNASPDPTAPQRVSVEPKNWPPALQRVSVEHESDGTNATPLPERLRRCGDWLIDGDVEEIRLARGLLVEAAQEIERLREQRKYVTHLTMCRARTGINLACDCGLDDLLPRPHAAREEAP